MDKCADVSNIEADCNTTTNFYGQKCKHYVACSAINQYSVDDRRKCELLETKSDCAADSDCKVGYSTCEPERIDNPIICTPSSIEAPTNCSGVDLIPS